MGPSTLTSWALLIARALSAHGIDGDALFRRAGLDPAQLHDPNARYPVAAVQRLWALATAAVGDPGFGLEVAQAWHPTTFHALGYAALASSSLRDALERSARYSRVVTTGASLHLGQEGDVVMAELIGSRVGPDTVPASIDAGIASIVILCREGRGEPIDPLRVKFARAASTWADRLEVFFRCPVEFGAPRNCALFRAADLDQPLRTANPVLLRVNEQVVVDYMGRLQGSDVAVRVHARLLQLLPSGRVSEAEVARALNLSVRTMQRKLGEQGMTFRALVDDTRRQLADQYLKDSMLSVSEIAYLLGFAEVSSFSRAFKRWTGKAPRAAAASAQATDKGALA
jgi:AraC-like DNA-binding protein